MPSITDMLPIFSKRTDADAAMEKAIQANDIEGVRSAWATMNEAWADLRALLEKDKQAMEDVMSMLPHGKGHGVPPKR